MIKFEINQENKLLWDKNFIPTNTESDKVFTRENDGTLKKAIPLNDDPEIQEYGAITDILKHGYLHKNYKVFNPESKETICFITKEPLKLYDVIALINGWEEFNSFAVFMGITDGNKYLFKYFHSQSDSIRKYTPDVRF